MMLEKRVGCLFMPNDSFAVFVCAGDCLMFILFLIMIVFLYFVTHLGHPQCGGEAGYEYIK